METSKLSNIFDYLTYQEISLSYTIPFLLRLHGQHINYIAWEAGVSRQFVNQVINGKRQSLSVRQAITKALGFNPWGT